MSWEAWGEPDEMPEGWVTDDQCAEIAKVQFMEGLCAMRAMLAAFVEQGGDPVTANSLRLNWNPEWGADPDQKTPPSLGEGSREAINPPLPNLEAGRNTEAGGAPSVTTTAEKSREDMAFGFKSCGEASPDGEVFGHDTQHFDGKEG